MILGLSVLPAMNSFMSGFTACIVWVVRATAKPASKGGFLWDEPEGLQLLHALVQRCVFPWVEPGSSLGRSSRPSAPFWVFWVSSACMT